MDNQETTKHLLQCHLQAFVPLMIFEFLQGQRVLIMPRPDLAQFIAENGDALLYHSPGRTAQVAGVLVEALATAAFAPGGVRFLDLHFEVPPEQAQAVFERDGLIETENGEWVDPRLLRFSQKPETVEAVPLSPLASPTFEELFRRTLAILGEELGHEP
ncbi:MAG: hypothetical protein BroJett011_42720 [Chloroflexota bacterium]|nr:MAG: hypothetical protein BroJett011_42720 [Chloroflexota bacterium]